MRPVYIIHDDAWAEKEDEYFWVRDEGVREQDTLMAQDPDLRMWEECRATE